MPLIRLGGIESVSKNWEPLFGIAGIVDCVVGCGAVSASCESKNLTV
jgi:hypothetical protein